MVGSCIYPESLTTSGYATNGMIHSDYQGQDERQKGMLKLMVSIPLCAIAESSRFIGRLDDPEVVTMTYLPVTTTPLAVNSDKGKTSVLIYLCIIININSRLILELYN